MIPQPAVVVTTDAQRTIPFDYVFRFELLGIAGKVHSQIVDVSVEGTFTAVSIGYGIVAVLLGAGAYLLVSRATTALGKIRALPKTQESLRENIAWMQSRSSSR